MTHNSPLFTTHDGILMDFLQSRKIEHPFLPFSFVHIVQNGPSHDLVPYFIFHMPNIVFQGIKKARIIRHDPGRSAIFCKNTLIFRELFH
jgi:hypothetical protein